MTSMLSGARVLVTGAGGFLGANLVRTLLREGAEVVAVVRPTTNCWRLRGVEERIDIVRAELLQLPELAGLSRVDIVYHLASAGVDPRVHDVAAMIEANVSGTSAVLHLAQRLHVERLVHVGSSGEYGPGHRFSEGHRLAPTGEYGATKAAGTLLAQAFSRRTGLRLVTLRPFSVFGPWEAAYRLVPYSVLRAIDGLELQTTDGLQTRDFVYVDDVMRACVAAGTIADAIGQVFNVCTGVSTPVREMVQHVVDACGVPVTLAVTRPHDPQEMWETSGDPGRAGDILEWRATTPLRSAVQATVEWFRRERDIHRAAYP